MNKAVLKKWWLWAIVGVILVGVVFSVWYTQVYTSEWGKGLSKEQKMVFEHVKKTKDPDFDITVPKKDVLILYTEMKNSGVFTKKFEDSVNNIKDEPDGAATTPHRLVYVSDDFIYYKKTLAKDVILSDKAKKIMPYILKNEDSK